MKKKIVSILLMCTMVLGLIACSSTPKGEDTDSPEIQSEGKETSNAAEGTKEEVKDVSSITFYPANANLTSGIVGGWRGDYLKDEFALSVEVWAYSDDKTNAILASGDLPDVMYVPVDSLGILIDSGMILNLDTYIDEVPTIANSEDMQTALNYVREYESNGTGSIYGIPSNVGPGQLKTDTDRFTLRLNWELYEEIGTPEFSNLEELIPILKQMQEKEPVSDVGVNMYAMNMFSDFDTSYFYNMFSIYNIFGYSCDNLAYLLETDMVNAEYYSILEEDSLYKEGLKFMNELYREGLLDPDSISYTRSQTQAIVHQQGSALAGWPASPGWTPKYYQYYLDGQEIYYNTTKSFGESYYLVVNARTENIEGSMQFLEMMADPDAMMYMRCGPEGETWYRDDKGDFRVTPEYIAAAISGETFHFSNGEEYVLWNTPFLLGVGSIISGTQDGQTLTTIQNTWPDYAEATENNEVFEQWKANTGYDTWVELLEDKDALHRDSELADVVTFAKRPDDSMQLMVDTIKDTVVTASWQMVYAESEEQFESYWNDMVDNCNALGADGIMEWRLAELEVAKGIKDVLVR